MGALLFLGFFFHLLVQSWMLGPSLMPPTQALVLTHGHHTPHMFLRCVGVVPVPVEEEDWVVTSRFPAVSSLHHHLLSLKTVATSMGTGALHRVVDLENAVLNLKVRC